MAFEPKDGTGALFKNNRKESDNHPDYTGNCLVDGQHLDIAAWIKVDKNGNKFMSLSLKPPRQRGEPAQHSNARSKARPAFDDSDAPPF